MAKNRILSRVEIYKIIRQKRNGKSYRYIADKNNISISTVQYWIKKYKICG